MKRAARFLTLSRTEWALWFESTVLLVVIRLGLCFLPFQTLRRILARWAKATNPSEKNNRVPLNHVIRAVERASRYLPMKGTCLMQALAAQTLLSQAGYPARLSIGVKRDKGRKFEAHAWLESEGVVVVGGRVPELEGYTPLLAADSLEF